MSKQSDIEVDLESVSGGNHCSDLNEELYVEIIATNCQLITSQAEHLSRMRSRCHPTAQLAQQEIRNVEEKILKLFSHQLRTKRELSHLMLLPEELREHPTVKQWLQVIGLRDEVVEAICNHVSTLNELLDRDELFLQSLAMKCRVNSLQRSKLVRAVTNLKKYTDCQTKGKLDKIPCKLYWDSWELCATSARCQYGSGHRASVCSSEGEGPNGSVESVAISTASHSNNSLQGVDLICRTTESYPQCLPPITVFSIPPTSSPAGCVSPSFSLVPPLSAHDQKYTPPLTPPIIIKAKNSGEKKCVSTPPPRRKNVLQSYPQPSPLSQDAQQPALARSTSHESRLSLRIDSDHAPGDDGSQVHMPLMSDQPIPRRGRLQSDSDVNSRLTNVSNFSTNCEPKSFESWPDKRDQTAGKAKKTSNMGGNFAGHMAHNVHHRFTITLKQAICGYCKKKIQFSAGLKCKDCMLKCHRDCKSKIPASCGLPEGMLAYFMTVKKEKGAEVWRKDRNPSTGQLDLLSSADISSSEPSIVSSPLIPSKDCSSSTSSGHSSTPSSPALIVTPSPSTKILFPFSDRVPRWEYHSKMPCLSNVSIPKNNVNDWRLPKEGEKSVSNTSGSASTDDSERTVAARVDSQDSTISESDSSESRCNRQNSVSSVSQSLKEWDIPYDELEHGEVIGKGRFGTVYSGNWHGQIAIKELNLELVNDEKSLEAFRAEVSTFRKTRHENLVLFMGACMKPPRFAIITSLVKGYTLYQHIHAMKEKFSMTRTIPIARQIVQGMSYLHGKGIVHKDVKTKNIFLENNERVVVTDFGLFNVTRLCYNRRGHWLSIPHGWLCYLAPEIMRTLRLNPRSDDGLLFTTCSDVFAFGTVWYELLCGEWPHRDLPPEAVIWQVGRGMKPSLAHLQASRNVKDILMLCWSYRPEQRPEFSSLLDDFHKLPKKRLDRSPSHPIQLSRSAESVF